MFTFGYVLKCSLYARRRNEDNRDEMIVRWMNGKWRKIYVGGDGKNKETNKRNEKVFYVDGLRIFGVKIY